jgi:hypothetical protein
MLSDGGISASPDKVKAVRDYPDLRNFQDIRELLGLASYYRRIVPGFAEVAKPIAELTRKD